MSSSSGISCRHGPHQVAQKLIITTWPLYWARSMVLPPRPESAKPGAGAEEVVASAAEANTAASAIPLKSPFTVRADMMLTPSEKDGRTQYRFDVVGDLRLA